MERGLSGENHGGARDLAYRGRNGVGVAHGFAAGGGEKRYVRSHIQLRAIPDGLRGSFNVFHATVGMPADVDGIDPVSAFVVRENRLDSCLCQRLSDAW